MNSLVFVLLGDNIQTALSVARECGIIRQSESVVDVDVIKPIHKQDGYGFAFHMTSENKKQQRHNFAAARFDLVKTKFAMTGATWAVIREHHPELIPKVVAKGAVFARMSGEQKQQLVEELQTFGYYVGNNNNKMFISLGDYILILFLF